MGNIIKLDKPAVLGTPVSAPQDNTRTSFDVGKFFDKIAPTPISTQPSGNKLSDFFSGIGKQESGNNYKAIGQVLKSGMHAGDAAWGKYQFMPKTLAGLGYNVTQEEFLNNPKLQEEVMQKFTTNNAKALGFTDMNNLTDIQLKALSMAHYGGLGKAKQFLKNGLTSNLNTKQMGTGQVNPSINDYANSVLNKMGSYKASNIFNKLKQTINNKE